MDWLLSLASASAGNAPALFAGFIIGWLICFTGVGGGVLVIPVLTFFFGLPVSLAVGTASAYTTITKFLAGAEHVRIRNINYSLLIKITAAALPGLLLSAFTVNYILLQYPAAGGQVQEILRVTVIAAILLSLFLALGGKTRRANAGKWALAAAGIGIGLVMGATGIGGGVLIAPALLLIGGETPKRVVGTSILTALALSGLTAVFYFAGGQLDIGLAVWMSIGSLIAIPLASRTLSHVSENMVRKSLLVIIALAVLLMLVEN